MATMQLGLWDRETEPAGPAPPSEPVGVGAEIAAPDVAPAGNANPLTRRAQLLDSLRAQVSRIETGGRDEHLERISCGAAVLDQMLPRGGLAPGTVNEWVAENDGCGAGWLSLLAARAAVARAEGRGRLVVIDGSGPVGGGGTFYPPAAIAAGIPAEQIIVVRPAERGDFVWAADQALRNPAVAVVWGFLDAVDDRDARRLQLAAEIGDSWGMFVRPRRALREPSWAEVRWHVRGLAGSQERRIEARLVRCRGGRPGGSVRLQIDSAGRLHHETPLSPRQTSALPLVAQLAYPAAANLARQRRA